MRNHKTFILLGAGALVVSIPVFIGGSLLLSAYGRLSPEEKKNGNEIFKKQVIGITLLILGSIVLMIGIPTLVTGLRDKRKFKSETVGRTNPPSTGLVNGHHNVVSASTMKRKT